MAEIVYKIQNTVNNFFQKSTKNVKVEKSGNGLAAQCAEC